MEVVMLLVTYSRKVKIKTEMLKYLIFSICPRDIEILGCCPVGPVLPYGEKVPL